MFLRRAGLALGGLFVGPLRIPALPPAEAAPAEVLTFPTGSFIDGGTIELGVVRDSVLNVTNSYQVFGETFKHRGVLRRPWFVSTASSSV